MSKSSISMAIPFSIAMLNYRKVILHVEWIIRCSTWVSSTRCVRTTRRRFGWWPRKIRPANSWITTARRAFGSLKSTDSKFLKLIGLKPLGWFPKKLGAGWFLGPKNRPGKQQVPVIACDDFNLHGLHSYCSRNQGLYQHSNGWNHPSWGSQLPCLKQQGSGARNGGRLA